MIGRTHGCLLWAAAICFVMLAPDARAQSYPTRPIKLVLPFAVGGAADITARLLGQKLAASMGQEVVIENRPSAGGIIAAQDVATADPDGYTLLLMGAVHAISESLMKSRPYNIVDDLVPISSVAFFDLVIVVGKDSPIDSMKDFIAEAKAHPGKINVGIGSFGTTQHLSLELFKSVTGVDVTIVPFKTVSNLITALSSGDIQVAFELVTPLTGQIKSGNLKALAVTSEKRFPALPDVPTVTESGLPAFEVTGWESVAAPAKTPQPIIDRLNKEIVAALAQPDIQKRFIELGAVARGSTPEAAHELLVNEIAKWRAVIKAAGIEPR